MRKRLCWIDALNAQTAWTGKADLVNWFSRLIARPANVLDGAIESFHEALIYMRSQFSAHHFGEPVQLGWLDTQLRTVTFGLDHHTGAQEGQNSELPLYRARVKGLSDSDLLRAVKETLLAQFAEHISEAITEVGAPAMRCEGLFRDNRCQSISRFEWLSEEEELRWRGELNVLTTHGLVHSPATQRCSHLFLASGKTRFCSDTCRFGTFQIVKRLEEPGYLAEKQRRYRSKRRAE